MKVNENKSPAKIKLVTTIRHPDQEEDTFELWVEGFIIEKQGQMYLSYTEIQEGGDVRTLVRMGDREALILRGGAIRMRLPYQLNEQQPGSYDGGFGSLAVTVHTHRLSFNRDQRQFLVEYDLLAGNQHVGAYRLEFTYTEES